MHRAVYILVLLSVAACAEDTFESLSQRLLDEKKRIRKFCLDNSHIEIIEVFDPHDYILKYNLTGFSDDDVAVQIRHYLIYVTAIKDGETVVKDVKILPSRLTNRKATWKRDGAYVRVLIPYDVDFQLDYHRGCLEIDEGLITVPKAA